MSERRGIVNPWAPSAPLRPQERKQPTPALKKDLEDIDFDEDLAIPGTYVIRAGKASFAVTSTRVRTPKDALVILAELVLALWARKPARGALEKARIGASIPGNRCNVPKRQDAASSLVAGDHAVWFGEQTLEQGALALVRVLRDGDAARVAKSFCVTPMTAA